ncbi:MAG: hypothetical protein DCO96_06765 [Fluviicola sp. XM-24bin1]|nr:MAG: hypothetical protein DCO96_06765 [Fluviicola sp. XM-24bin1]
MPCTIPIKGKKEVQIQKKQPIKNYPILKNPKIPRRNEENLLKLWLELHPDLNEWTICPLCGNHREINSVQKTKKTYPIL